MQPNAAPEFADAPVRELWLFGATLEQAKVWAEATRPFLAARPDTTEVSVHVTSTDRGLVLRGWSDDAGWLHALAMEAERANVASVTLDGSSFEAVDGFYALTARRPGQPRQTLWLDPLRGLTADAAPLTALVESFRGEPTTLDYFLWRGPFSNEVPLGRLAMKDDGVLLPAPRYQPFVGWQDDTSAFERAVNFVVLLSPMGVTWLVAALSAPPESMAVAMGPAMLAVMITGLLAFASLVLPTGHRLPWFVRGPWLLLSPFLFAAVRFRLLRGDW